MNSYPISYRTSGIEHGSRWYQAVWITLMTYLLCSRCCWILYNTQMASRDAHEDLQQNRHHGGLRWFAA